MRDVPLRSSGIEKVHQISMPYDDGLRRRNSNNEFLHNSSLNESKTSKTLDSDVFVMSNTSMSQFTQSMVLGQETERGNFLKDSGVNLQEDSTAFNDGDDFKALMNSQNREILHR